MKTKATAAARPGRPKSDQKRRAILAASARLFLHAGYKDTSMDEVAAAAGVSKQTVYSHFDTKEMLLRACVEDKVREHGLRADDMPHGKPLREALGQVGRQFVDLLNDDDVVCMYRLLISECVAHPSLAQAFFETGPKATCDVLTDFLLANDIPSGRFGDATHAAELFFIMLEHVHFMQRILNLRGAMSAPERTEHVDRVVAQFLKLYS
jgi:TetR/AcrR family transcriptional repressor of mexJK operon